MKHTFIYFILSLPLLHLFPAHSAYAETAQSISSENACAITNGEIDRIAGKALEAFAVPGVAVGLVRNGEIVHARGYGTRKYGETLPVTERTLFPIASCTKAFTAFLAGQLVDEGILSLDDPVTKYVPELVLFNDVLNERLTVRDLLAHRAGIERHDPIWIYSDIAKTDILGLMRHLKPVCGLHERFQYNNFMYVLAGIVIERVTGMSWEECLIAKIYKPLGMCGTNHTIDQLFSYTDHAFPHASLEDGVAVLPFRNPCSVNPCIGINSNVAEMAKWLRLHLDRGAFRNIIDYKTLLEMHSVQMPFLPSSNDLEPLQQDGYGLGWYVGRYRGHCVVSHGGNIDGFVSFTALFPDQGIGLVILTNSGDEGDYAITAIARTLFDQVLKKGNEDWVAILAEKRDNAKSALKEGLRVFNETCQVQDLPLDIKVPTGCFKHPAYGTIEILMQGSRLELCYGKTVIPLYYKTEDVFTARLDVLLTYGVNPVIDITCFRDESGDVVGLEVPFEHFRNAEPVHFYKD